METSTNLITTGTGAKLFLYFCTGTLFIDRYIQVPVLLVAVQPGPPSVHYLNAQLESSMDEGHHLLHVLGVEAPGGEGGGAQPDAAGVHGRLVPGHCVLILIKT